MRTLLLLLISAGAAQAHVGHLGEIAGHDHWVAGAAVAAALALAAWQLLRGEREEAEGESEGESEEAEA